MKKRAANLFILFVLLFNGIPDARAATATSTNTFDASLESYSSSCGANVTCGRSTSDGSPGTGSLDENLATKNKNQTWQWELPSITWESLGIPSGATVTSVDGKYNHKSATFTSGSTGAGDNTSGALSIRDSSGNSLMSLESAVDYTGTAAWATRDATGDVSVPAGSQTSSTSIRIRLNGNIRTQNVTGANVILRQDQIVLTITYTEPPLSVDIVDASGNTVSSPSVTFSALTFSYGGQTSTGTLGVSAERIRISNPTSTATWTLSIAATSGATALWSAGTPKYDYNDASGASDGSDTDSYGGQLTIDPSVGTVTAVSPCSSVTGISKGSSNLFSETSLIVSSITLLTAGASASTNCTWDFTGVSLSQSIPAAQSGGTYTVSFTLTAL